MEMVSSSTSKNNFLNNSLRAYVTHQRRKNKFFLYRMIYLYVLRIIILLLQKLVINDIIILMKHALLMESIGIILTNYSVGILLNIYLDNLYTDC